MAREPETVSAIEPAVSPVQRWAGELKSRVRQTGDEIRKYKGDPSFNNAVEVLTALIEIGNKALADVPAEAGQQGIEGGRSNFVNVHNRIAGALVPDEQNNRVFLLPAEASSDTKEWENQIRTHFSTSFALCHSWL